jgi:V/A-type H+-transporting ATPase subunit K
VLTERPELFGKVFLLTLLPSTQGLYGLVFAFLVMLRVGFIGGGMDTAYSLTAPVGIAIMAIGILMGLVLMLSAIYQARVIASGIAMVARQEERFSWAILIQALIETFAVFGLVVGIVLLYSLVGPGVTIAAAAAAAGGS